MKKSYINMRKFWLDVKNMDSRKGILEIGADKICVAGVELATFDGKEVKHLMLATNSLGDCSLYFENNSKNGLGGMIGGGSEKLHEVAAYMLAHASRLTSQMVRIDPKDWKELEVAGYVRFFAVSKDALFIKDELEEKVRETTHPFYPFFAYSQQLLAQFKEQTQSSPARA